ncbi:phage tail tape measure protein [Methylobacterium phyllosphaerae]
MSNLTSTLTLQLKDDGLQAKAKADAEALKKLGATGADLKKLAATHPEIGKLVGHLDTLATRGGKLDAFRAGAKNLKQLGAEMRVARANVVATASALEKAEGKGTRAAEKSHRLALRRSEQASDAWREQAKAHRALRNELVSSGVALGGRGSSGGRGLAIGEAMREVSAHTEQANHALRRQVQLIGQAGNAVQRASRRAASAPPGLIGGMGASGRAQLGDIEARRRVAHGMGAPARASREAADAAALDEAEKRQARRQEARDARKQIAGAGLLVAGHKAAEAKADVLHTYEEFDDLIRYQGAVADLSPDEKRSRVHQAVHLGATTRFNDLQVLHAQLDLAQRGVKKEFIEPFIGEVVNYAQAMNTDLGSAAKTLEGILFSTNQNVDSPSTALSTMRRQVNLAVKMAKLGGLNNDDVSQAFKFGGASGSAAGLTNETQATIYALLRRNGYEGSAAGVFGRAAATKLVAPTNKGLDALDAMGIKYENYTTMPKNVRDNVANNTFRRHYGKSLTPAQEVKFKELFQDEDKFGDRNKFIEAATDIVSSSFGKVEKGKNKGKLSAQDRKSIAKTFGDMHKYLVESVDSEGLWNAILDANPTLGQAAAYFTKEHAGKVVTLARKREEYKDYHEKLEHAPNDLAEDIGGQRNAGYAGASKRLAGSKLNLETATARALDNGGEGNGGLLTSITSASASAVQSLAELPPAILATGAAAAYVGGKASTLYGGALLTGAAAGLTNGAIGAILSGNGAAVAAAATTAAAAAAPVVATAAVGAALIAADKSKGIVHGGKNVDTRLDFSDELPGLSAGYVQASGVHGGGSLPPGASQPGSRAAEGVKSLIDQPATPKVETGKVDELSTKLGEAKDKAAQLGSTTATPQVGTGPVDALIAKVNQAIGLLAQLGSAAEAANVSIAGVNANAGRLRGRSSDSFSDGVTAYRP